MQHCPHGDGAELEIIAAILERLEAGLESAVQLDKPGFIGREALLAARGLPLRTKLVTIVLDGGVCAFGVFVGGCLRGAAVPCGLTVAPPTGIEPVSSA